MIPMRALPHRLSHKPYLGDGAEGRVYGDPVADVPARCVFGEKLITDSTGRERVVEATIYYQPVLAPRIGDLVTLPDGETTRPVIHRVENAGRAVTELVTVYV